MVAAKGAGGRERIELTPPDIEPYRNPGGRWPYVTTLESGIAGPHVAVAAIVHGNEPCGAIALDWLFRREVRPARGRLSLAFVNVEAYRRFDPQDPGASRWVDEDFNRLWDETTLAGGRTSCELRRARALRDFFDDVDLLLDLHSMQHASPPLTLAGTAAKGAALARRVGVPPVIVGDAGHAAGRRLRDYGAFADPADPRTALLVECGQHWAAAAAAVAIETTVRFLRATGAVAAGWAAETVPLAAPAPPRRIEVTEAVTVASRDFRFTRPFESLEVVPEAGTIIARDAGAAVVTPYPHCVLVMPSRRLVPGQTAVRLGRFVA